MAKHGLLPKLEETPRSTIVVADGFSCRSQIEQLDGRKALHIAQVIQQALRESGRTGPEATAAPARARGRVGMAALSALSLAAAALAVRRAHG